MNSEHHQGAISSAFLGYSHIGYLDGPGHNKYFFLVNWDV